MSDPRGTHCKASWQTKKKRKKEQAEKLQEARKALKARALGAGAADDSNMQRRTACFDPGLTAVLPARPPAALEAARGLQEHSRPCDAAWAALLPALRIGASACDM